MSYFHWKYNQLSSALRRFTVLFGMGRSGIGAKAFHCPVRNGKEWDHPAMVAWLSLLSQRATLSETNLFGRKAFYGLCSCTTHTQ